MMDQKLDQNTRNKDDALKCCVCSLNLPKFGSEFTRLTCCGRGAHDDCARTHLHYKCTWCRAQIPTSHKARAKNLRKWVKKGKAWAQVLMAQKYKDGHGVKQSDEMAIRLFQLAVQQGCAVAIASLGDMYLDGRGVEQSKERATELHEQAANLGYTDAQCNLGLFYLEEQSFTKASFWLKEASTNKGPMSVGSARAQYNLGLMYYDGIGVEEDVIKARRCMTKSAAQGNTNAMSSLKLLDDMDNAALDPNNVIACSFCALPQTLSRKLDKCPCRVTQYCDKACQKRHRKDHKKECIRLIAEIKRKKKEEEEEELDTKNTDDASKAATNNEEEETLTRQPQAIRVADLSKSGAMKMTQPSEKRWPRVKIKSRRTSTIRSPRKHIQTRAARKTMPVRQLVVNPSPTTTSSKKETTMETKEERTKNAVSNKKTRSPPLFCRTCGMRHTKTKRLRRCLFCCDRDAVHCSRKCKLMDWPKHQEFCIRVGTALQGCTLNEFNEKFK